MSWTDADDVIDSWIGDDAPTDENLVTIWVERAERHLKRRVPSLSARITEGEEPDLLESVKDVVSNMVQRVFRNPDGTRQRNSTTGPYTESVTYGGDQPGYLWLTDDEFDSLIGLSSSGAFMVDTLPPDAGSAYPPVSLDWS